ncbi:MAG: hypothetical protein KIT81_10265 [Alphaproteobacteria bacterium]|nr:hypothetical protein [Alphaproteobacteria bacterium]
MSRLPIFLTILALVLLPVWSSAPLAAERTYEPPRVEYRAERLVQRGGRQQAMRVHYVPGKERLDLLGTAAAGNSLILRHDLGQTFVVMPRLGAYGVAPPDVGAELDAILRSLRLTAEGREVVEGVATTRYRVRGRLEGRIWLDPRDIPVRIQGRSEIGGEWQETLIEQRAIEVARQDPSLFEVPPGLGRIDMRDPVWAALVRQVINGR